MSLLCFGFPATLESVISHLLNYFVQNITYSPLVQSFFTMKILEEVILSWLHFFYSAGKDKDAEKVPYKPNASTARSPVVTVLWTEATGCLPAWPLADTCIKKTILDAKLCEGHNAATGGTRPGRLP